MTRLPARLTGVVELARAGELYVMLDDDLQRAIYDAHALSEALHGERLRRDVLEAEQEARASSGRLGAVVRDQTKE